jgi:glycosyltransferase A (GT-A) superfamily protein (DUF2064 family)
VLVLAKAPVAGQAKTRLCPPATPADAARIAAAALLDTLDNAAGVAHARVMVAWTGELADAEAGDELARALADTEVFPQCAGELGQRIAAAHLEVARRAPGSAVLQIGMDTPQIDAGALTAALARLHGRSAAGGPAAPGAGRPDAVLGPALDGGWWALGLHDPARASVLADVSMSRPDTGTLTWQALSTSGLTVEALPEARDVDTAADAQVVAAEAGHGRFAAEVRTRLGLLTGGPW